MDLAPRPLMWNLGVSVPPRAPVSWLPQGHEWRFASVVRTSGRYAWSGTLTAIPGGAPGSWTTGSEVSQTLVT